MNCEDSPGTAVIFHGEPAPKEIKPSLWDWIKYYAYNWSRKPQVWRKQKRLQAISKEVQADLNQNLYPVLLRHKDCLECLESYLAMRPQIFLSQIEFGLRHLRCEDHPGPFITFFNAHEALFRESERLSKWINGFGS